MDIDTDQLKAALNSDILILDCRRDGKYNENYFVCRFLAISMDDLFDRGPKNLDVLVRGFFNYWIFLLLVHGPWTTCSRTRWGNK